MLAEPWAWAVLLVAGLIGGAINVIAGGGSIITVPMMIFLGVPGPIANGTNRVAILAQNIAAISTFKRHKRYDYKLAISLSCCALPGALLGAWVGTNLGGERFNQILAVIMVGVLIYMQFGQAGNQPATQEPKRLVLGHALMVLAGFWGGFIQIGMGFILMPILNRVMGLDLVSTNLYKVFIVAVYTVGALAVFAVAGEVFWFIGCVLAVGNSLGGYLGAKLTLARGDALIRRVLTVAIIAMVTKLLFFS